MTTKSKPGVVLGVDPGTLTTGWALLRWNARGPRVLCSGAFRHRRDPDLPIGADARERVRDMLADLDAAVSAAREADDSFELAAVAAESFTIQRKLSWSAVQVLRLLGALEEWAQMRGADYQELTTQQVKARLGVNKKAADPKEVVQRTVQILTGHELARQKNIREHEADAIAVGIAAGAP